MKNMCSIFVYVNSSDLLTIQITPHMGSFIDHQTALPFQKRLMRKTGPVKARSYDQIIIFLHTKNFRPRLLFFNALRQIFLLIDRTVI